MKTDEDLTSEIVFEGDKVKDVYLDKCDGIYAEILQATRLDESIDLITTWISKNKEDLQPITSQLKCFSYNTIIENRMTRKGGGLACIYMDDLTVEKIKAYNRATFELLLLKIKIASQKQPSALVHRTPY